MAKTVLKYWSLATFKLGPAIHLFRTRSKNKVVPVTPDGNGALVPPIETIIESFSLTMHWSDTGLRKFLKDPAIQDCPLKAATDETRFPLKPPTRSMTSALDAPCRIVSSDLDGSEMMKKSPRCLQGSNSHNFYLTDIAKNYCNILMCHLMHSALILHIYKLGRINRLN